MLTARSMPLHWPCILAFSWGEITRASIVLALVGVISIFMAFAADARSFEVSHWCVASDGGYLSDQGGSATTLTAGLGYRFNRYFAIEGGYSGLFDRDVSAHGGYADVYRYIPLDRNTRFSLFGTAGVIYISSVATGGSFYSASASGVRGGGGFEWRIGHRWAVRAAVRYQNAIANSVVSSVGFSFQF
jgi:outer membrane protein with beta-barrel domain